ncbi:PD-(D/E)XK nuclease domain-containing protein [Coprobacillaceae bacterium CR2/5/TPMF4]|nr:PD-(D/E)XK nuclease domain-containing protein [Coprobacillaceae bacterium CR2/5/TPMF4]
MAYITARDHYTIIREMPTGKGFADLVFIPRYDKPAMIVELKWDQDVKTAITQIKEKKYPKALDRYQDNLLIIGITYNRKARNIFVISKE